MNLPSQGRWSGFGRDLLASIVVFLVALPLCLGIALASGLPPAAGLITGIVGGLLVSTIAGSPLQVSGPAAGVVVLTYDIVQRLGVEALGIVLLICGVIQATAGVCRLGQWFRAVSPTVVHAMLTGIGILIVAGQIHVMVDDRPRENGLENLRSIPEAILKGLPWPRPTSNENRSQLAAFLKQFGALHEGQVEIQIAVDSHVSRQGTTSEHERELSGVSALVSRQEALVRQWERQVQELVASQVAPSNPDHLSVAVEDASNRIQRALHDLESHRGDEVRASQAAAVEAIDDVIGQLKSHDWAAKIGLLTMLLIIGWNSLPKRISKKVPSLLLAVIVATAVCAMLKLPVLYVEIPEHLRDAISLPSFTALRDNSLVELVKSGFLIAIIASAETLLCATAVDRMHSGPRTHYDRELLAQGVGNFTCGMLGALPLTGVIVRSAANVQAGAQSRWSAFMHGAWLLIIVVLCGDVLRMIPTACLAGILVYTGYKLIDWRTLTHLWHEDKWEAAIFVITVALIVGEDLLMGVATGLVLSALKLLVIFSKLNVEMQKVGVNGKANLHLIGAATFLRLPILASKLEEIPQDISVRVNLGEVSYLDDACFDLIVHWARQREVNGTPIEIEWGRFRSRLNRKAHH